MVLTLAQEPTQMVAEGTAIAVGSTVLLIRVWALFIECPIKELSMYMVYN